MQNHFILLAAFGAFGCGDGPTFVGLCNRMGAECNVPGPNVADCREYAAETTKAAEEAGCDSELDDYLTCVDSSEIFCGAIAGGDCPAEEQELIDCGVFRSHD